MDFETIVSLSHPLMVQTIGKDLLLEKLDKYYENEEYRLREQLETLPFQYGMVKKIEGKLCEYENLKIINISRRIWESAIVLLPFLLRHRSGHLQVRWC